MTAKNGKGIESNIQYEELDLHGAVLLRPDTYVGCTFSQREEEYVSSEDWRISFRDISYVPGLLRIFVEALSNVIDNKWRGVQKGVHSSKIKVNINRETGQTRVWNDGLAIPIQINEKSGLYNPELIFGRLLTGSNYDDKEKRYTSGRNGLGIKLLNIFSICFRIRIYDPESGKFYEQEWRDNMTVKTEPKITQRSNLKTGYTEVTWIPDFKKFGITGYNKDTIELFRKHICDMAMITNVPTFYNGEKVPVRNLLDYSKLYNREGVSESLQIKMEKCQVVLTPSSGNNYEAVSFVNGVHTKDGGVHVRDWTEALFRPLVLKFNKPKKPSINIKDIKQFFRVFINCIVPNPQFDSQSKTKFTGPAIKTQVLPKHINALMRWEFVAKVKAIIEGKELLSLKRVEKTTKRFQKIEGYDRANLSGEKKSLECTLILCEGLSAKTYAVAGIDQGIDFGTGRKVGRDYFGIMPLRGKVLNVRKAKADDISKNKEIKNIIQALGVRTGIDYTQDTNFVSLNYGRVMILADADVDGIHIQALIFNVFHHLYPTLLERDDFMVSMQTPIVRVVMDGRDIPLYSEQEYHEFMGKHKNRKYTVKYYKGLGTSEDHEIEETFGKRVIEYHKDENADKNMNKVFHSKFADKRKEWIAGYRPGTIAIAQDKRNERLIRMDYTDFIDTELIKFSVADCERSIPHIIDGLKCSQRKVLYACILKNLKYSGGTIKVAQLAGFVAEKTNYHHGEQCLWDTITHMGQEFPGSNNIPLLYRGGQFGSRLSLGKDAASARYIFTKLDKLTRLIFRPEDDVLLERVIDDGEKVEPRFYVPIIPMLLVNGIQAAIGTGWSCSLPCFNPLDLIGCVKEWMNCDGKAFEEQDGVKISYLPEIVPWYRGFTGPIEKIGPTKFLTSGRVTQDRKGKSSYLVVDELPVGLSTDKFKESLEDMIENKALKSIKNQSNKKKVRFIIYESDSGIKCSISTLKLTTVLHTSNMVMFTENGQLRKFKTLDEIIDEFCKVRYKYYGLRKKYILEAEALKLKILNSKVKFLGEIMDDTLVIRRRDVGSVVREMEEKRYYKKGGENEEEGNYTYLLNLPITSFTKEKLEKLKKEIDETKRAIAQIKKQTEKEMWLRDLDELEKQYPKFLRDIEKGPVKKNE